MSQQAYVKFQGRLYTIRVPNGSTTAQAALVFASEAAKGNVSKLAPGGILASPDTLASLRGTVNSRTVQTQGPDYSREERETAGVGRENEIAGIIALTKLILSYPLLKNFQPIDGVTFADYVTQTPAAAPVANLNTDQVQVLMAALAAEVAQDSNVVTQEKGIGRYGFNALQLELTGYLKPGTALKYFNQGVVYDTNPDNFVDTMKSPSIWSGKDNITSVDQVLEDKNLQATIAQELYQKSYTDLLNLGTVQSAGVTSESMVQGLILQNAVKYGVQAATSWAIDLPIPSLANLMQFTAKQALYGLQLLDKKILPNETAVDSPTAYISTDSVISSVDDAVRKIINDPKIGAGPGY
jgi:hypothetical protein